MAAPVVSVVIPSLGRHAALLRTLSDLLEQDHVAIEIVVVDQNPGWPESLAAAQRAMRRDPRIRWLERARVGVVRARNVAVAESRGELLVFVDDDVWIPDPGFIRHHVEAHAQPDVASICGRELKMHQIDPITRRPLETLPRAARPRREQSALGALLAFDRSASEPARVAVLSTCNGSIKREAFLEAGGFDESFRGASYGDDADLVLRMAARGLGCAFDPRPWLVHLLAPTGGLRMSDRANGFSDYDRCLSGLIFLFRHADTAHFWPLLYGWVLRRSVLLRQNVVRPWRQPLVAGALIAAAADAWRAAHRGPISGIESGAEAPPRRVGARG